jgi:hypothetical protein
MRWLLETYHCPVVAFVALAAAVHALAVQHFLLLGASPDISPI